MVKSYTSVWSSYSPLCVRTQSWVCSFLLPKSPNCSIPNHKLRNANPKTLILKPQTLNLNPKPYTKLQAWSPKPQIHDWEPQNLNHYFMSAI